MSDVNVSGGAVSASKIVDINVLVKSSVTNDHGENLGRIESLMFDLETGKLAYLVLSFGSFPNRAKLFALPWDLLNFSHHDKKFILNIPRSLLEKSSGYDTMDQLTQSVDFSWLGEIFEYYNNKTEEEQKRKEEREVEVSRSQQKRNEVRRIKS